METHAKMRVLVSCLLLVMPFDAGASDEHNCRFECPAHPLQGATLPIDSVPREVSVWVPKSGDLYVNFARVNHIANISEVWVNVSGVIRDGKYCVAAPGFLGERCHSFINEFSVYVFPSGLFRFDCESGTSCGYCKHRLLGVEYDWSLQLVQLYVYMRLNTTGIKVSRHSKILKAQQRMGWYDISIHHTGSTIEVESFSLFQTFREAPITRFMVESIGKDLRPLPTEFAFGCHPPGPTSAVVDSCVDGCPAYRLSLVEIPLSHSNLNISVWSDGIPSVKVDFGEMERNVTGTAEKSWLEISSAWDGRKYCLSTPGLEECYPGATFLRISQTSQKRSLLKFNCENIPCECHHRRLHRLGFKGRDLPARFFWRPGPKVVKFMASENVSDVNGLLSDIRGLVSDVNGLFTSQRWYDVHVLKQQNKSEGKETTTISIKSLRLRQIHGWDFQQSVIFAGVDENGEVEPSDFAFGCSVPPNEGFQEGCSWTMVPDDTSSKRPPGPGTSVPDTFMESKCAMVLIVLGSLVLVVIVLLIFWLRRRAVRPLEASQHQPHMALCSLPPPPVPLLLEESDEEALYCEVDQEALKMQLTRKRMGRRLLTCSILSWKKGENEKDGEEEKRDYEDLESYSENVAEEDVTEWTNPCFEPIVPEEDGVDSEEKKRQTNREGEEGKDVKDEKKDEMDSEEGEN